MNGPWRRRFPGQPFRRRTWRGTLLLLAVAAFVVARLFFVAGRERAPETLAAGAVQIARVVDGDTLLLSDGARVRLYGVDAPESVKPDHPVEPWGPEASAFTQQFVSQGDVRLAFDRERQDRFGRFLAYVWVGDELLNEELLRAGLARAQLQYHYSESMKRRFRAAEQEAKRAQRGIWSHDGRR